MSPQSKPPYGPQFVQAIEFLIAWGERRNQQRENDAALAAAEMEAMDNGARVWPTNEPIYTSISAVVSPANTFVEESDENISLGRDGDHSTLAGHERQHSAAS